jgi:hypothetical protein
MHIDGACHCGAVTFTAQIDPARAAVCHCTDCQVMSGSAFRLVVLADYASLELRGRTKQYVKTADSGNRRAQVFCPECATPLYATSPENPVTVSIRLGCVKQRAQIAPLAQVWHRSALPWVESLPGLPAIAQQ